MEKSTLDQVVEFLEKATSDLSPELLSRQQARAQLAVVAKGEKLLGYIKATLSARADDPAGLARLTGTSVGQARKTTRLGRRLEEAPRLAEAVRLADVSLIQAEEIVKTEDMCPGSIDELIDVARTESFHVFKEKSRAKRLEARDREDLARLQHEMRRLQHWVTDAGMVHLEGDFEPVVGTQIVNRLEEVAGRLARAAHRDGNREPFARHLADALPQILDGATGGGRPELVVLVSHGVALRDWTGVREEEHCKIPGVGPISPAAAKQIAEDAFLTGVLFDGEDLRQIKRWTRSIPVEVRAALRLGSPPEFDGPSCIDCGNRNLLELDHVDPHANGGPSSYENLEWRCVPECHGKKTRQDRKTGKLRPRPREGPAPP